MFLRDEECDNEGEEDIFACDNDDDNIKDSDNVTIWTSFST